MALGENVGENVGTNTGTEGGAMFLAPPTVFNIVDNTQTQNRVDVTWVAPSKGGATGYNIYSTQEGFHQFVAWGAIGATVIGLSAGTTYEMWVVTTDGSAESDASNTDTITTNPAGARPVPSVYTRFIDFTSGGASPGEFAVGQHGNFDFDYDGISGDPISTISTDHQLFGYNTCKMAAPAGNLTIGGNVGVRSDDYSQAPPIDLPIGTEIWAQVRVWVPQAFVDNGGLLDGNPKGYKFWRWRIENQYNNFNTLHPTRVASGAPSDTSAKLGIGGILPSAAIGWPTLPNNGRMLVGAWNTYEMYYRLGDGVSMQGLTRVWKEHIPATGYHVTWVQGQGASYSPITDGGGYEIQQPHFPQGSYLEGTYNFLGVWDYCDQNAPIGDPTRSGPCTSFDAYTACHVIVIKRPGESIQPGKVCPTTGHRFIGDWEND